ncbi:hypothetical protein [Legionella maioricensis]|nr:hypothetical protein [Legionella maioricensis]
MMKRINFKNTWRDQLFSLFGTFNEISVSDMGLPVNWKEDDFWK